MVESRFDRSTSQELVETLRDAQRLGFFGAASMEHMIAHARQYLEPLRVLVAGDTLCDLGSGGGLPGLVIAEARPDLHVTLVDRRQKRTDFLVRAQLRLGLVNTVVVHADVDQLVRRVGAGSSAPMNAVTARGFGPPSLFLATASGLLASGGLALISEPPDRVRWTPSEVAPYGLQLGPVYRGQSSGGDFGGGIQTFHKTA